MKTVTKEEYDTVVSLFRLAMEQIEKEKSASSPVLEYLKMELGKRKGET